MNKPQISLVAAIDDKRGIGKDNKLLFKISEDLKRFREITKGHAVIMGRKTYDSIVSYNGKPLPGRLNIVLSPSMREDLNSENDLTRAAIYHNIKFALQRATKYEQETNNNSPEVFIIGGGQIFKIALEVGLIDRIYLTKVKGDYHADAFFPDYEDLGFKKIQEEERESEGYQYTFVTLEK